MFINKLQILILSLHTPRVIDLYDVFKICVFGANYQQTN